jgi:transposase
MSGWCPKKRPACGGAMARLGEDVTPVLDYIPGRFQVIRYVRPKYACRRCDAITQAPAPALPTPRGRAAPGLLAHVLVSKYTDHLPSTARAKFTPATASISTARP